MQHCKCLSMCGRYTCDPNPMIFGDCKGTPSISKWMIFTQCLNNCVLHEEVCSDQCLQDYVWFHLSFDGTVDVDAVTPGLQTRRVVSSQELSYLQTRNLPLRNVWPYTSNRFCCTILFNKEQLKNPSLLQRCLCYKIEAKRKKRIQISVSISRSANADLPAHGIFPLHVLFARATSNDSLNGHSPVYRFSRACLLTSFSESGYTDHTKATFTIPDWKSLATSQVCDLNIILISCEGQRGQNLSENFSGNLMEYSSPQRTSVPQASIDSHPALHVSNHSTPAVLEFGKSRKLSVDRAHPRKMQKREFFHSQKAQRVELEEVLADHDSEDEIDDDIADFEDMMMLDVFSDVTKDEKRTMHMWNSFVRRQRVLADAHIPWACTAFSQQHGQELVHDPALRWCWRFVMIKLWNHSLLDARTMNTCNKFLDDLESESSAGPKQT